MSSSTAKALRILSLDGGGVKGFSSLLVLERIFRTIQRDNDLPEIPRPCDYFDLIGGTSTGGYVKHHALSRSHDTETFFLV
jgi:patatin-like phospholipase/acyl hydrolase